MQFGYVNTNRNVKTLTELLDTEPVWALDIETTGLNPHKDKITSIALCSNGNTAWIIDPQDVKILDGRNLSKLVLHNFKFDANFLYQAGVDIRQYQIWDTMLVHHLLNENAHHSLDDIVQDIWKDNYKEVFWGKYKAITEAPEGEAIEYAGKDVIYTRLLFDHFNAKLSDVGIPQSLVDHVHNLALTLYETELQGLKVDKDYLMILGTELKTKILKLLPEMRQLVDFEANTIELEMWEAALAKRKSEKGKAKVQRPEFTFDSPKQLLSLIYDKLNLPLQTHAKTKRPTVDDGALENLKSRHPVIPKLQEYRALNKVYTAYVEGTLERMHNGRIYPSFNINGTVTGRISSSNPNMQQLPREGGVRGLYIPDEGNRLISCDYSQLEVVVAAHYSLDPNLLKIVLEGASKHDITAQSLKIERHHAKTLNFAMQYQCSPRKVSQILGVSPREAELIWAKYWETYAGEKKVIDECKAKVDNGEPIRNPFGRLRRFPKEFANKWEKEAAYRQAYSSLIQGTGSDITHWALYTTRRRLRRGKVLYEVHDEILIESPLSYCAEAKDVLCSTMIEAGVNIKLNVPLAVDCSEPLERWTK